MVAHHQFTGYVDQVQRWNFGNGFGRLLKLHYVPVNTKKRKHYVLTVCKMLFFCIVDSQHEDIERLIIITKFSTCSAQFMMIAKLKAWHTCTFQILGGCQGRRTVVGVTTVSNSLILGGWVTKVLKNGDKKIGGWKGG